MIVPYADAAALMLANLDRGNAMSRHRVGLALPEGDAGTEVGVTTSCDLFSTVGEGWVAHPHAQRLFSRDASSRIAPHRRVNAHFCRGCGWRELPLPSA